MNAHREPPHTYRLCLVEFYSANVCFVAERILIDAPTSSEALGLARMYVAQSPFFNMRIPELICLVSIQSD